MKLTTAAAVLALTLAPLSAHAILGTELGARASYWAPKLSGDLTLAGSSWDLEDDLDMEDGFDQGVPGGEVFLQLGDHILSVAGYVVDYSGAGDSSLEYTQLEATYQWNLVDLENWIAGTSFGPVLQVKYLDGDAEAYGVSESFRLAVPMIGLGGHVGILANLLEARARALWVGYKGNHAVDAFGEITYSPFPFVDLSVGYRYLDVKADADDMPLSSGDFSLEATQSGPYAALSLKIGL